MFESTTFRRRTALECALPATLTALVSLQGKGLAQLEAAARTAVTRDSAGLLARHPLQARTIVQKFIRSRFRFEPLRHSYKITATASTALIVGAIVPALFVPPLGQKPSRKWPQRDSIAITPSSPRA